MGWFPLPHILKGRYAMPRAVALAPLLLVFALAVGAADPSDIEKAEAHFKAARAAAGRRDFARARQELAKCIALAPDRADARLLAARTARRMGDYAEAEKQLKECQRLKAPVEAVKLERALLRAQRGEVEDVEKYLTTAVKKGHPDRVLILEALARGYLASYRLPDALRTLGLWLGKEPKDAEAFYWRGEVFRQLSRAEKAVADYRLAIELDPQHDRARLRLAEGLLQSGDAEEALKHYQRLQKRRPKDAAVRLGLARCAVEMGKTDEGKKILDRLLADEPRNAAALSERGRVALQEDQAAAAEKWLRQAVALAPADYTANYRLAMCLSLPGKDEEFRKQLARVKRIQEDVERLQTIIRTTLPESPTSPAVRHEGGMILLRLGRDAEALRWLAAALRLDPRHKPTHRALADYYTRIGKKELAAKHRRLAE